MKCEWQKYTLLTKGPKKYKITPLANALRGLLSAQSTLFAVVRLISLENSLV